MKSPCIKCPKRASCTEMCDRLSKLLPSMEAGIHKKEILVDPSRIEKYGDNINCVGINPDNQTKRWLSGKL